MMPAHRRASRLPCVLSKAQVGKMWWSSFRVPHCLWMARRLPVGHRAAVKVCFRCGGLTGPLYTVQMQQQTGNNTPISHVLTGSVGLNLALTILLPTKENGQPAGTIKTVADYIAATVALNVHFSAVASGSTDATLGATLDRRMAGRIQWATSKATAQERLRLSTFSAIAGSVLMACLYLPAKT